MALVTGYDYMNRYAVDERYCDRATSGCVLGVAKDNLHALVNTTNLYNPHRGATISIAVDITPMLSLTLNVVSLILEGILIEFAIVYGLSEPKDTVAPA
jgi:hypothetical protein